MNWKPLFARDSWLWKLLFLLGSIVVLFVSYVTITGDNPADYGIIPIVWKWLAAGSAIITGLSGKMGMSPAELKRNQKPSNGTTPKVILLALLLPGLSGAWSCGPKTKLTLAKFDAGCLSAVQTIAAVEVTLTNTGQITLTQALTIRRSLAPVIDVGIEATEALMAWHPGDATPRSVLTLASKLTDLLDVVTKQLPEGDAKSKMLAAIAYAQSAWAIIIQAMQVGDTPDLSLVGVRPCPV